MIYTDGEIEHVESCEHFTFDSMKCKEAKDLPWYFTIKNDHDKNNNNIVNIRHCMFCCKCKSGDNTICDHEIELHRKLGFSNINTKESPITILRRGHLIQYCPKHETKSINAMGIMHCVMCCSNEICREFTSHKNVLA